MGKTSEPGNVPGSTPVSRNGRGWAKRVLASALAEEGLDALAMTASVRRVY
ncbi:MAG: hypothetical protein H0T49_06275 [Chloroflexia bacterium]|nr:hypothetical protein [Chloroflexia bacterium]